MCHGCRQTWDKEAQRQRPSLRWKYLSVFIALTLTCSFLTLKKRTVELRFNEPIYNEVLDITNILVVFSKIRLIEMFDITNPPYNEQISQSLGTSLNRGSTECSIVLFAKKSKFFFLAQYILHRLELTTWLARCISNMWFDWQRVPAQVKCKLIVNWDLSAASVESSYTRQN